MKYLQLPSGSPLIGPNLGTIQQHTQHYSTVHLSPCLQGDLQPINIRGEAIEAVSDFRYLGAIVESDGGIMKDVGNRIARASKALGGLRRPVFGEKELLLISCTTYHYLRLRHAHPKAPL